MPDELGRTPLESASPAYTGNLYFEGGLCPGDSSPESPFLYDTSCHIGYSRLASLTDVL